MYRRTTILTLTVILTSTLAACSFMREGMEGHKDNVAIAEGYPLTIDHAAQLIALGTDSMAPALMVVVDRTIELWVGYAVLASEFAKEDRYSGLNLDPITRFGTQQALAWKLRDKVMRERAVPDEATLRQWYDRDQPFALAETHHILIRVPASPTAALEDSLRTMAETIRDRLLRGEAFDDLARRYSEDPSSASRGGALGWVRRGQLVPEIDGVLFDMEIGVISEVIRTTFGFHVVKVTGHRTPEFDDVREDYETQLTTQETQLMERAYVDSITASADITVTAGSANLVRLSAFSPRMSRMGSAERNAALARFRGGKLTFGQWADFVIRGAPNTQSGFAGTDSAGATALLARLAINEILAKAAIDAGEELDEVVVDSLVLAAERDLRNAAFGAGIQTILRQEGGEIPDAVDNAFDYMLVRGRSPKALDRVSPALHRDGPSILVHPYRYRQVLRRLVELRGGIEAATPQTK
jgi:hypothetical protein